MNGVIETTNLVSWPVPMPEAAKDATVLTIEVPTASSGTVPVHLRHRLRYLFNQHILPQSLLIAADADGKDSVFRLILLWQFLAVVEHQLFQVAETNNPDPKGDIALSNWRCWCAGQEVRLCMPDQFTQFLDESILQAKLIN